MGEKPALLKKKLWPSKKHCKAFVISLEQTVQQMWQMFRSTNHTNFFKEQCDDDITSNKLSYHKHKHMMKVVHALV